jgi:translation initiation factor IF-3
LNKKSRKKNLNTNLKAGKLSLNKNSEIKLSVIKVIGIGSKQLGLVDKDYAVKFSRKLGLDLINVFSKDSTPPICKILKYDKYLYLLKKRNKRSGLNLNKIKEVKFNVNIGERDLEIKVNRGASFLKKMIKVKFTVVFRKKFLNLRDRGTTLLNKIYLSLNYMSRREGELKNSNRCTYMSLVPLKKFSRKK